LLPNATPHDAQGADSLPSPSAGTTSEQDALLSTKTLRVEFPSAEEPTVAVQSVSFDLRRGERLGIVGESGSGKSMTGLAIMGLVPSPGQITHGSIRFKGRELVGLSSRLMNKIRGAEIAMIFQDPSSSLNPTLTVEYQIAEVISRHQRVDRKAARLKALEALKMVNINAPERVAKSYPFQLSGGMQQRVMIATALSCNPDLLIADEPTTALDVTTQAQILRELDGLVSRLDTAIILVTHDLGLVAEFTDRVVVMQQGVIREAGPTKDIVNNPKHEYTKSLLNAVLALEELEVPRS
jgi:ABC-type dipeptide/oligopeptide/nickel transport system ATPase component